MNDNELLDIYSDYLISAFGLTTATGLAELLGGAVSHDRIQRFLAGRELTSADVWRLVKPHVRAVQQADGVLMVDDSIAEKAYTDENDIVCWHYDHAEDRTIKGINFLTVMYHAQASRCRWALHWWPRPSITLTKRMASPNAVHRSAKTNIISASPNKP